MSAAFRFVPCPRRRAPAALPLAHDMLASLLVCVRLDWLRAMRAESTSCSTLLTREIRDNTVKKRIERARRDPDRARLTRYGFIFIVSNDFDIRQDTRI